MVRNALPRVLKYLGLGILLVAAAVFASAALSSEPTQTGAGANPLPTVSAHPARPIAVFIGDTMTSGVGASTPSKQWTSLLSAAEGWQEVNLALGGTGYYEAAGPGGCGKPFCPNYQAVVADAVGRAPDVVVVSGGQSDRIADPAAVSAAVVATYKGLRVGLPSAKIIAVGPAAVDATAKIVGIDAAVKKAAASVGAVYVSLLDPNVLTASMLLSDGVNVDDAGHAAIAARIEAALK